MTLATVVEKLIGEQKFVRIRDCKVSDTVKGILGERRYVDMVESLRSRLVDREYSTPRRNNVARLSFEAMRSVGRESYYGCIVDAIAQNIVSLPYILNDRYRGKQSWRATIGTRINAVIGNTLTGRPYGHGKIL